MSNSQAIALKGQPDPGAAHIPWQYVEEAINTSDATRVSSYAMPYLTDTTVGDFINQITKGSPAAQREALDSWMTAAITEFDQTAAIIHLIAEIAVNTPNLVAQYGGQEGFKNRYPTVKTAADYSKKRMQESTNAVRRIQNELKGSLILSNIIAPFSLSSIIEHHCVTTIAFCLARIDPKHLAAFLNSAVYRRLGNTRKRKDKFINSSNWTTARTAVSLFKRDIQGFVSNPSNANHPLVQLAKKIGAPDPYQKTKEYTVALARDKGADKYKF
jgi:hypothetical protein